MGPGRRAHPGADQRCPDRGRRAGVLHRRGHRCRARRVRAAGRAPARRREPHWLPSPNGSTVSTTAGAIATFTACLRNCRAVAAHALTRGLRIAVVPAGEQWGDGALRPAIEDLIGAGAVLACLPGRPSPEAETAIAEGIGDARICARRRIRRGICGERGRARDARRPLCERVGGYERLSAACSMARA